MSDIEYVARMSLVGEYKTFLGSMRYISKDKKPEILSNGRRAEQFKIVPVGNFSETRLEIAAVLASSGDRKSPCDNLSL
jgi:hypothetical protein